MAHRQQLWAPLPDAALDDIEDEDEEPLEDDENDFGFVEDEDELDPDD